MVYQNVVAPAGTRQSIIKLKSCGLLLWDFLTGFNANLPPSRVPRRTDLSSSQRSTWLATVAVAWKNLCRAATSAAMRVDGCQHQHL